MIKLTDLLKEIEEQSQEQEIIDDLLGTLNEGAFDDLLDKVKDYAKRGLLTAGVLAALMAAPQLSAAQKAQVQDIAKKTAISKIPTSPGMPTPISPDGGEPPVRDTTPIDGKIGSVTSQFTFPDGIITSQNYLNNQLISATRQQIPPGTSFTNMSSVNKFRLTPGQMIEWNDFISWMKKSGYSGNDELNHNRYDKEILAKYRKIKPDFWIKGDDDVKKVQETIKAYRVLTLRVWLMGPTLAKANGFEPVIFRGYDYRNIEDQKKINDVFIPWAK